MVLLSARLHEASFSCHFYTSVLDRLTGRVDALINSDGGEKKKDNVLKRTIIRSCGKHIRSNQGMIQRIRKAFDVLKTLFFRASRPKHGSQLWQQHHHKAHDALRAATRKKDGTFTNMWDRWERDLEQRKAKEAIGCNDAKIDISRDALAEQ